MSSSEDDRSGDEREDEAEYEVQAIIGYRESDTDGDEESSIIRIFFHLLFIRYCLTPEQLLIMIQYLLSQFRRSLFLYSPEPLLQFQCLKGLRKSFP